MNFVLARERGSRNKYAPTAARLFLGLAFFVFGLNGFLHFLPMPPAEGKAGAFLGALAATGYMFPLIKGTEVVAGALLLADRYVPLALLFLAPIVLNIVAYHGILAPAGVALPLILAAAGSYLAWVHRARFAAVLQAKNPVGAAPASASGKVVASAAE